MTERAFRQRIRRPEAIRIAPPPPWAGAAALPNPTLDDVRSVLDPMDAPDAFAEVRAAVLLPVLSRPSGLSLLFTRRAATLSRDPGNLAFPGGRREGDEPIFETALRESEEEIGLDRRLVSVLGSLAPANRVSDQAVVAPFVGAVTGTPEFVANPDEVEAIFEVPIASLYVDGIAWEEHWTRDDAEHRVAFFAGEDVFGDDLLWGLTARITWQLLVRLWSAAQQAG